MRTAKLAVLLPLVCAAPTVQADALSELPGAYAARLQPLAEIPLDALDSDSRAQLDTARAHVVQALAEQAGDAELAEAFGELCALYHVQNVFTPARTCYENAILLAPDEFRWTYYAAWLDVKIGEFERAVSGLLRAREIRPEYLAVTLRLADAWRELNELDRAEQAYRSVLDSEGLQAAAHYGLGQIALLRRDNAAAIDHYEQALALQPDAGLVHYSMAQALRATGQEEAARRHLALIGSGLPAVTDPMIESLEALRQGATVHFLRAMKASRKQDFAAARDAFAAGLEREPDNVNARVSLARTLYLTGDRPRAQQELENAAQRDPGSAMAQFLLGVLAEEDGDGEAALQHYTAALQSDPGHSGANYYLANAHNRAGRLEPAERHYAASIETSTDNPSAWLALCGVRLRLGHDEPARAVIADAIPRYPDVQVLALLQIQLEAQSGDAELIGQARTAADALVAQQDIPPHRELQALALAAAGDFETAATVTQALAAEAMWGLPGESARLQRLATGYRENRLPENGDLFTWTLLQPPPVQARGVFHDYPTPRPY